MVDKKFSILVFMNVILMILCSLFLLKSFNEQSSLSKVSEDTVQANELARQQQVGSAAASQKNVLADEPSPDDASFTEESSEANTDTEVEVAPEPNQAEQAAKLAKAQAFYEEKAKAYKLSLQTN